MRSFVNRRQWDAALGLVMHIIQNHMQFNMTPGYLFNTAVDVALQRGDWEMAQEILRNMRYRGIHMREWIREKVEAMKMQRQ